MSSNSHLKILRGRKSSLKVKKARWRNTESLKESHQLEPVWCRKSSGLQDITITQRLMHNRSHWILRLYKRIIFLLGEVLLCFSLAGNGCTPLEWIYQNGPQNQGVNLLQGQSYRKESQERVNMSIFSTLSFYWWLKSFFNLNCKMCHASD